MPITVPMGSTSYAIDLLNLSNIDVNYGARIDFGFGLEDDPVTTFSSAPGADGRIAYAPPNECGGLILYDGALQQFQRPSMECCGNGVVESGETCDDGGESATCDADCTIAECGDGTLNTTVGEACDDGPNNSDTIPGACSTTCEPSPCGNGELDAGEACDDGPDNSDNEPDACRTTCVLPSCGDGVVDTGEECDDGNTEPGDGCDENCLFEPGACCAGTACSIATESDCLDSGGTFFGFNTACNAPDADGDGLRDECDGCPADSNKIVPGICGCGVNDTADSDDDGVPDCEDHCPGSDDNASGALGDTDGDGFLNCNDLCPGVDDTIFAPECEGAIPTTSQWGLIVLTLLLLAGGKRFFGIRAKRVALS